jgi:sialate O-acetylesterase
MLPSVNCRWQHLFQTGLLSHGDRLTDYEYDFAKRFLRNKQVLVKSKQKPDYIYYGWQPFSKGNLVNKVPLPASTFKLTVK